MRNLGPKNLAVIGVAGIVGVAAAILSLTGLTAVALALVALLIAGLMALVVELRVRVTSVVRELRAARRAAPDEATTDGGALAGKLDTLERRLVASAERTRTALEDIAASLDERSAEVEQR